MFLQFGGSGAVGPRETVLLARRRAAKPSDGAPDIKIREGHSPLTLPSYLEGSYVALKYKALELARNLSWAAVAPGRAAGAAAVRQHCPAAAQPADHSLLHRHRPGGCRRPDAAIGG